ncbi:SKP1 component [Macleaya cordata]|uniref:SKP1-like protein n=1 Tax=Macleaya cordata TaxID=56857 RepID=A0A200RA03_MACCD|nr:SKP1 component [Macleaya cordata]
MMKKLILKSSDEGMFEIDESVAVQSDLIKQMIDVDCVDADTHQIIPLPEVKTDILSKVIEYCKKHESSSSSKKIIIEEEEEDEDDEDSKKIKKERLEKEEKIRKWDEEFMKQMDHKAIFDIILAANYMNIKSLMDLGCQTIADLINGKKAEEIREIFGIKNDFTPEEEEEIKRENQWTCEN